MQRNSNRDSKKGKVVYIRTFGCQMNVHDSDTVCNLLRLKGYLFTDDVKQADVVLVNTCSVRQHAEDRVWGWVGQLAKIKDSRPNLIIGIIGCMAQNFGEVVFQRLPHVDIVCGTGEIFNLPVIIERCRESGERQVCLSIERPSELPDAGRWDSGRIKAFVTVMHGCDNFCSYCVVPYVRGRESSRRPGAILDEIKSLRDCGVKEVTLLGQNVNSYGRDSEGNPGFVRLLEQIDKEISGVRIRFLTSHPKDCSIGLINAIGQLTSVCEHLHLPLQSASDKILGLMNRGYTAGHYRGLVEMCRDSVPDAAITTDIIVGFPGESEEDFLKTRDFMREIEFDSAFVFKYSDRPMTKAESLEGKLDKKEIERRHAEILNLQREITEKKLACYVGKRVEVLVEDKSKYDEEEFVGRTRTHKKVVIPGKSDLVGRFVNVDVTGCAHETLRGRLC